MIIMEFLEFHFFKRDAKRSAFPVAACSFGEEVGKENWRCVGGTEGRSKRYDFQRITYDLLQR